MLIIERYARNCPCYKNNEKRVDSRYSTFQDRGPKGLMLHSVGCPQPRADVFAERWDRADNNNAITQAVLQADGTVYQLMPWNYRAWHAGGSANDTHIGVEMTEPAQITYTQGASFTCSDIEGARKQAEGTYRTAVELFAYLCDRYGLDPMKDIVSHNEGHKKGIASGHADPEHLWKGLGMGYTMDGFRADVKAKLDGEAEPEPTFADVPAGAWYAEDVQWAYENGLMIGVDERHFNPEGFVTRAQMATILRRMIRGEEKSYQVRVTAAIGLNVRSGPGMSYPSTGALEYGDTVSIFEEKDGWGRVNGGGWISLDYTEKI